MVSPCSKYVTCANAFETGRPRLYIDCSTTDLPTPTAELFGRLLTLSNNEHS
jgi:hypothetical protein